MSELQPLMGNLNSTARTFDKMSPEEWEKYKADDYNRQPGTLNQEDGYDCPICQNKGHTLKAVQDWRGWWSNVYEECKCMKVRGTIRKMQRSGLGDVIRDKTFDKYKAPEEWQQVIKGKAREYAGNPRGWFFIGGQSGAGKSHLCTAICREFLLAGREVVYMVWSGDIEQLQGLSKSNPDQRMRMMDRLKNADVLYIDDMFKPTEKNGVKQAPSAWDIKVTFEIINARYNSPNLPTIISSEWTQDGLVGIDQATGGRIKEMAGEYAISIKPDIGKNHRLKGAIEL